MDMTTLGAALAIVKGLPDKDISRAESAADRAEQAAEEAATRNYGIRVQGTGLVIESEVSD